MPDPNLTPFNVSPDNNTMSITLTYAEWAIIYSSLAVRKRICEEVIGLRPQAQVEADKITEISKKILSEARR